MKHRSTRPLLFALASALLVLIVLSNAALGQAVVALTEPTTPTTAEAQHFVFVSDGPIGPGWSRPDEIARTYFHERLPAFFTRTIVLKDDVPERSRLSWIFTGAHAGFTITLSPSKLRLTQRYYNSTGLGLQGGFPERIVRDDERSFAGHARTITVAVDYHLSITVFVNGVQMLQQQCVFDVTRHQLMLSSPRNVHNVVEGGLLETKAAHTRITVRASDLHQQMLGFGGSPSIPAYAPLSDEGKARYWELMARYNLAIDREYPIGSELKEDLSNLTNLSQATPHYYGDNFPNGEISDFDYTSRALKMGGFSIYEMWALPKWAVQPYRSEGNPILDAWGKAVRFAAKPDVYARIVVEYCRQSKLRTGAPPAVVGIQNEVEQPPEVFDEMVLTLRRELDRAGFASVKIHMADASFLWMAIDRAHRLKHNPAVWKAIDFTAAHEYDYQEFFANPDLYDQRLRDMREASGDKPFLATEICINDPQYQEPSYRIAFNTAQLYHKNLTLLDAVSLMYCWLILDVEQPNFAGSRSLLVGDVAREQMPVPSSFQLRVLGAFSRHVLRGMTRVSASADNADLLTSAYTDGKGRSTLIVMNRSTSPHTIDLDWSQQRWTEIERTSPYLENAVSNTVPSALTMQPGEILSLSTFQAQ